MERFLWICFAGALGTGARYLIALWAAQRLGSADDLISGRRPRGRPLLSLGRRRQPEERDEAELG
jgi:hypothetical protein